MQSHLVRRFRNRRVVPQSCHSRAMDALFIVQRAFGAKNGNDDGTVFVRCWLPFSKSAGEKIMCRRRHRLDRARMYETALKLLKRHVR